MSKKVKTIVTILAIVIVLFSLAGYCVARFVYLSPACYADSHDLTDEENYAIKKLLLETIEEKYSVFSPQADEKNLFIWIDSNFMNTVKKVSDNEYRFTIQTHFLDAFEDSIIDVQVSTADGYHITAWGLDP